MQTWKRICEASRKEFSTIYERLDVRLLWRGESYYNSQLRPLVEDLHNRGTAVDSKGALVSSSASPSLAVANDASRLHTVVAISLISALVI